MHPHQVTALRPLRAGGCVNGKTVRIAHLRERLLAASRASVE